MPDEPTPADRTRPERLALGEASRLLGVDPDTLRRWADEGRVPAFTTPGGHRRFDRRSLERLMTTRRTGPGGALSGFGATPARLTAAYRRRYGEEHGPGPDPRASVPAGERETFREAGRRLVDALVRHLDATGGARSAAEREAAAITADIAERLALLGVPLDDAVTMFVTSRRPFLGELGVLARRRGVDAARVAQLYDASTGLLDRLILVFVAAHAGAAQPAARPAAEGAPWT